MQRVLGPIEACAASLPNLAPHSLTHRAGMDAPVLYQKDSIPLPLHMPACSRAAMQR